MRVEVLWEYGSGPALFGLGLSYGLTSGYDFYNFEWRKLFYRRLERVSQRCAQRGNGEEKFLRMIQIWADITAPRFWWAEFDTYKVGTVALSESTMHTLGKRPLTPEDFETPIEPDYLDTLNSALRSDNAIDFNKGMLPEGFLQRRIVNFNYAVLANMIRQRSKHKLPQWRQFLTEVRASVDKPEFLPEIEEED